jgi:hypothetical protein
MHTALLPASVVPTRRLGPPARIGAGYDGTGAATKHPLARELGVVSGDIDSRQLYQRHQHAE